MNDSIRLFLLYDPENREAREEVNRLAPRIDGLMKENGWEYTGLQNMYRPVKGTDCDEMFWRAEEAVKNADWLRRYNPFLEVSTRTNVCRLDDIVIKGMSPVSRKKMERYRKYFEENKRFAHGIVVDENRMLIDGYTTYLLAKESGKKADIMRAFRTEKLYKIVYGRHVTKTADGYARTCQKSYIWRCNIREAVVPGDILLVDTKQGRRLMCVDWIFYDAGPYARGMHRSVIRHTGNHL